MGNYTKPSFPSRTFHWLTDKEPNSQERQDVACPGQGTVQTDPNESPATLTPVRTRPLPSNSCEKAEIVRSCHKSLNKKPARTAHASALAFLGHRRGLRGHVLGDPGHTGRAATLSCRTLVWCGLGPPCPRERQPVSRQRPALTRRPSPGAIPEEQLQSCGAKDCLMAAAPGNSTQRPSPGLIYTLLGIYTGACGTGAARASARLS